MLAHGSGTGSFRKQTRLQRFQKPRRVLFCLLWVFLQQHLFIMGCERRAQSVWCKFGLWHLDECFLDIGECQLITHLLLRVTLRAGIHLHFTALLADPLAVTPCVQERKRTHLPLRRTR